MARILLTDDDRDVRFMARFQLERAGFAVDEACDGAQALERLLSGAPPDAVLLDLNMPCMGGLALLREIRRQPALDGLPVVVLSAHATPEVVDELIDLGCRACIAKPYSGAELVAVLRRMTETSAVPASLPA